MRHARLSILRDVLLAVVFLFCFVLAMKSLDNRARLTKEQELRVSLPVLAQIGLAGGDRYLAANLGAIRSIVAETEGKSQDHFAALGKQQVAVSFMNPAHQDNYYSAAAILPWKGQLGDAQQVLARAVDARPFDMWPGFYYGFNVFWFDKNPPEAAKWLLKAGRFVSSERDRTMLQYTAAKWFSKAASADAAAAMVRLMAEDVANPVLKKILVKRVSRLESLAVLQDAAARYRAEIGATLSDFDELVRRGYLPALPDESLMRGYALTPDGVPVLRENVQKKDG